MACFIKSHGSCVALVTEHSHRVLFLKTSSSVEVWICRSLVLYINSSSVEELILWKKSSSNKEL